MHPCCVQNTTINANILGTPSTTNLEEEEETVDALGNNGKASMPEQVNRPNPWKKKMVMILRTNATLSYR